MIEDWEKDFSGLEKLRTINKNQLTFYLDAAQTSGVGMEFKHVSEDKYEIWTPKGMSLSAFWNALKQKERS